MDRHPGEDLAALGDEGQALARDRVRRHPADLALSEHDAPGARPESPAIVRSSVVLPAPLAPMTATVSPWPTWSDTPQITWIFP